jgi:hypothetical protein
MRSSRARLWWTARGSRELLNSADFGFFDYPRVSNFGSVQDSLRDHGCNPTRANAQTLRGLRCPNAAHFHYIEQILRVAEYFLENYSAYCIVRAGD